MPGVHRAVSDAWMLAEALCHESLAGATVADVCTGTGVLAIEAARQGAARVYALDVSRRAVTSARLNALLSQVHVTVRRGDLLAPLRDERVDVIVSNPPYIPAATDQLPRHRVATALDAGVDGRALIDRICAEAGSHLRPGGRLLLVHSSVCNVQLTCETMRAHGLEPDVVERRDGPLGPVMRSRAALLRERGLLGGEDHEEIVVVRGLLSTVPSPASPSLATSSASVR